MPPQFDLTTLTNVRLTLFQQNITSTDDDDDDPLLKRFIAQASSLAHRRSGRTFVPYLDTRLLDYYSSYHLNLDTDLLVATAITNGNGDSISLSDIRYEPGNETPKWRISCKRSSGTIFQWQDDPEQAIEVTGIWGYHTDYGNAWIDTLIDVPAGDLASGATSVIVSSVTDLDNQGHQAFEVGGLYRIDSEYIKVVAIDTGTKTLTLRRAQLGTTAAEHLEGASIERWQMLPDVEWLVTRLVTWAYQHRDTVNSIEFLDTNVTLRDETIRDIFAGIDGYQRKLDIGVA